MENGKQVESKEKKVVTTLDNLPFGTDELIENMPRKYSNELPDGVTSRMLYGDILRIAWPSMIERTLAAFAAMVNMMMVGQLGPWAITSVGLASMPRMLMVTMIMALNIGSTAHIARSRGAGNREKANAYLRQAILLGCAASVAIGALGFSLSELLVRLMGAPDEVTLKSGTTFLQIQSAGFIFIGIPITITAALRGVGNTRAPMIYNMIAAGINIVFNLLLVEGRWGFPRLEVAGTSIATLAGQVVASIIAIVIIIRKDNYIHLDLRTPFKINTAQMQEMLQIGMPAVGEQVILRTGLILVNRVVAELGTNDFAANQIVMNFQSITMINGESISTSATTLMGQSIGKRHPDLAQAYTSRCRRTGLAFSFVIAVFFIVLRHPLTRLYTDNADVVATSAFVILILAAYQPFQAAQFIVAGALRGAGDTFAVAVVNFICALILRPVLAAIAVLFLNMGVAGAWYAFLIDQIIRSFIISKRFSSGKWKKVFLVNSR